MNKISGNSSHPLIFAPNKNKNILECKCKSYRWYNLCSHTVAVACDTGISFDFFSEIKKKVNLEGKKRGLTKALEFDLTDKEKRMNQDEIAKKNSQRKKKKETPPDQPQPSSLRANPSSCVRTPPNPNLQQSVGFASHQNGEFT